MARPDHQHGLVKWYNIKAGYGFITLQQSGKDVFVHATGLTKSLKENPPREGDRVLLNLRQSDKGLEASDVAWSKPPSRLPMGKPPSSRKAGEEEDVPAKICACIYAAKAIAGSDIRRLPELIPILLQHNGLPVISIPLSVFSAQNRSKLRPTRRPAPRDHRRGAQGEDDDVQCQPQKEEEEEEATAEEEEEEDDEEEENDEGSEDDGDSEETEHEDASADNSKCSLSPRPPPAATNTPRPAATTREDEPPPAAVYRVVQPPEANARKAKPPPATTYKIVRAATTREVKPPPTPQGLSLAQKRSLVAVWDKVLEAVPGIKLPPIVVDDKDEDEDDDKPPPPPEDDNGGWRTAGRRHQRTSPTKTPVTSNQAENDHQPARLLPRRRGKK